MSKVIAMKRAQVKPIVPTTSSPQPSVEEVRSRTTVAPTATPVPPVDATSVSETQPVVVAKTSVKAKPASQKPISLKKNTPKAVEIPPKVEESPEEHDEHDELEHEEHEEMEHEGHEEHEGHVDETTETPEGEKKKVKRQRAKPRPFEEIRDQLTVNINAAYKLLQTCVRDLNALKTAHKLELSQSRTRESNTRTATCCLGQPFIDYLRSRLDASDFTVTRSCGNAKVSVDLTALDTETRLHRTDVTQLYCKVFEKCQLKDPKDGRLICYQKDPELTKLLTTGVVDPELAPDVQALKDGTYQLTIFNMQKFCNQYFHKATPVAPATVSSN